MSYDIFPLLSHNLVGLSQIIEYRTVRVLYTSRDDGQLHTNILRCSPSFHSCARYDSMIVDTGSTDKISFAKLIFMFKCMVDKLTGFQCITLSPPKDAEFLFLNSVICGAYIAPASDS
ncbi:hypothetical protein BS47DRAFT_1290349 [Hydnum rufescens UP504]|uniref:Uncharacterized protein n=1 Tax=Hydnum rufescens UP504 TaxID=1448309 RepID=A0A9P6E150_9AGAM|nr:hypothetical protein BS47DRAFT_1290349 [Hydnum rufescens UP504]